MVVRLQVDDVGMKSVKQQTELTSGLRGINDPTKDTDSRADALLAVQLDVVDVAYKQVGVWIGGIPRILHTEKRYLVTAGRKKVSEVSCICTDPVTRIQE